MKQQQYAFYSITHWPLHTLTQKNEMTKNLGFFIFRLKINCSLLWLYRLCFFRFKYLFDTIQGNCCCVKKCVTTKVRCILCCTVKLTENSNGINVEIQSDIYILGQTTVFLFKLFNWDLLHWNQSWVVNFFHPETFM